MKKLLLLGLLLNTTWAFGADNWHVAPSVDEIIFKVQIGMLRERVATCELYAQTMANIFKEQLRLDEEHLPSTLEKDIAGVIDNSDFSDAILTKDSFRKVSNYIFHRHHYKTDAHYINLYAGLVCNNSDTTYWDNAPEAMQ
jgi:hypothetical protein